MGAERFDELRDVLACGWVKVKATRCPSFEVAYVALAGFDEPRASDLLSTQNVSDVLLGSRQPISS